MAAADHHVPTFGLTISLAVVLIILCTISTTTTSTSINTNDQTNGFSVRLVHRDSPHSPFYNHQETSAQRTGNSARRSIARAHRYGNMVHATMSSNISPSSEAGDQAELIADNFEYLMNISIGTPPFPIIAIADTGSDIIWTQCKPCTNCYKQDAPLFDPSASSTYKPASCSSKTCVSLSPDGSFCPPNGDVCQYRASYGDGSHTRGDVAVETLTLESSNTTAGGQVSIPNIVIGCGHDNGGTFSPKWAGIVGLGTGPASLITQLGPSIGGKFSYCMAPYGGGANQTISTMNFGQNAVVSGSGVVPTPLSSSETLSNTFYFLQINSVSVGSTNIPFEGAPLGSSGNIIIDSGSTLTIVPTDFMSRLSDAIVSQVKGNRTKDPQEMLSPCYVAGSSLTYVPPVTVHFQGGDVVLAPYHILVPMSDTVVCLAFYGYDGVSIYGNMVQQNFLVGYDLQKQTVSFKPTDCTKN